MSDDEQLDHELAGARPAPGAGFRGGLRRDLLAARPGRHRPQHLWVMAGASAGVGAALLIVAAVLGT